MTDKGVEGGSKPRHEIRWRRTDRTHTNGTPIMEKVSVKIDPTNPENVPTSDQFPPQRPPEVIRDERKEAQIDDWHNRTDI